MKKRGIIELQFNWIFVIIAGAIIFLFFINIVNKQREFSEMRASGTIVTNLDSILTGAQISTNTINVIEMPKLEIGFECNRYFVGPAPKSTKGNVIFAPGLLKGKEVITWTKEWNMPYRVTNFLYITDPELRYIIINNSQNLGQTLFDELPDEMNKEVIDPNELKNLKNKNNYKVKFIFLGGETVLNNPLTNGLEKLKRTDDEDITAINITTLDEDSSIIPTTGTIVFLKKDNNRWEPELETHYLNKESFYGAIFAEDRDMYNCVMKKAFKKLNLVTTIYLERSEGLGIYYGDLNEVRCSLYHNNAKNYYLDNIKSMSEDEINEFPPTIDGLSRMNAYAASASNIKDENQKAQLFSCALIY